MKIVLIRSPWGPNFLHPFDPWLTRRWVHYWSLWNWSFFKAKFLTSLAWVVRCWPVKASKAWNLIEILCQRGFASREKKHLVVQFCVMSSRMSTKKWREIEQKIHWAAFQCMKRYIKFLKDHFLGGNLGPNLCKIHFEIWFLKKWK